MAAQAAPQSSAWLPNADYGGGLSTNAKQPVPLGEPLKSEQSQASRALGLASYFLSGSVAINLSQVLGSPLYLINKDWYNTWIAFTMQSWGLLMMTLTQWWAPTKIRVSGDSSMRGQLVKTTDPGLLCDFPERIVLMANHQIYTDWLYLWWIGYTAGMHGRIYVVLKESLKNIPVIGWGMQFAQFIFLKRNWEQDKPGLAKHMQKFNQSKDPMWLMLFPEGTNLASCTREKSKRWADRLGVQDMKHTLLPRATGLHFMLSELQHTVDYVFDCTMAYEGVPHGTYAQDIFTVGASYFGGRPPKSVNMYWRRFKMSTIPLDDPKKFELWLRLRWREKDKFIEHYLRHGRFPADSGSSHNSKGEAIHGAGFIEAEIKPKYWYEFLQVFAPIGLLALVLYLFYGSLPQEMVNNIKSVDQKTVMKQIEAIQKGKFKVPETKDLVATAPKDLQDKYKALQTLTKQQNRAPEKLIAEAKKTLPAGALPAGDPSPLSKPVPAKTAKTPFRPPIKPLKKTPFGRALEAVRPSDTPNTSADGVAREPAASKSGQMVANKPPAASRGHTKSPTPAAKSKPATPSKGSGITKLGSKPSPAGAPPSQVGTKTLGPTQPSPASTKLTIPAPKARNTEPQAARVARPIPSPAQQDETAVDKNALRQAKKKHARIGKQEPPRKVRRALQDAS